MKQSKLPMKNHRQKYENQTIQLNLDQEKLSTGVSPFSHLQRKFQMLQKEDKDNSFDDYYEEDEVLDNIMNRPSQSLQSNIDQKKQTDNNFKANLSCKAQLNDSEDQQEQISSENIRNSQGKNNQVNKQSFSLKQFNPNPQLIEHKSSKSKTILLKNNNYNIRDAIQKNDLVRIRNGSPGSRNKTNETNQQLMPKPEQKEKQSFENEMMNHGIIEDLQEINRFNYVLLSRSVDFDQYDESQLTSMCNQGSFFNNKSPLYSPLIKNALTTFEKDNNKYILPYQRRMKSASPPRLQICNENYIVYS